MNQADIPGLLSRLSSDEDALRKMAVFKLQSSINDPSFADLFIASGGLSILRHLLLTTGGNTLAYSLQSLSRLLEVDMGWEIFESPGAGELVERVVELIVTHPLVNILRGAMSVLVAVVSHPQTDGGTLQTPGAFGFRALKPAIAVYPQFFEMVVSQVNSADHALCANALMLLNALMRDALMTGDSGTIGKSSGTGEEWPKFIKRLQDLGVIRSVSGLMQSSVLQDLAYPLLEFQTLTKVLLRKWRDVKVDLERPDHRRALKGLHLASAPDRKEKDRDMNSLSPTLPVGRLEDLADTGKKGSRRHNPEKWRRLGFETESPAWEFDSTGYLGMMDLTDYVRKQEDNFQKLLLEQSSKPLNERCPIARTSLAVTSILYTHFEVDKVDLEDAKAVGGYQIIDGIPTNTNYDKFFRPLILQWSRLHTAGLQAFFRLWKSTGATQADFDKVAELTRILIEQVVGQAPRTKDIADVEEDLADFDYHRLRELQMDLLELTFEDHWGPHLRQVRDELKNEALQFVKEQRVRCLLQGAWFPRSSSAHTKDPSDVSGVSKLTATSWRYVRLSHNRRFLHYAEFPSPDAAPQSQPTLDLLPLKIDLSTISSVVSNVSATGDDDNNSSISSAETLKDTFSSEGVGGIAGLGIKSKIKSKSTKPPAPRTKITINSYITPSPHHNGNGVSNHTPHDSGPTSLDRRSSNPSSKDGVNASSATTGSGEPPERALLTLAPQTHSLASEWLDGLLMLLNQAPITAETSKLVQLVADYGLKIRLLNVGAQELTGGATEKKRRVGIVPSREGLDEDYWFEV